MMDIMKMTWKELEALPKEKTILFLTFAPVEEHSQHIPLGVDILLGETWTKHAAGMILKKEPGFHVLTMPPIPFACASVKGFPGNLHVSQRTVFRVAFEILDNIAGWGIKNIVVVASHGDPKHLIAIEEACAKINRKHGVCAISPMGAFFSYDELGIDLNFPDQVKEQLEKYPNDYHAGWIETSAMLDINPLLVKENFSNLPDIEVKEKELMFPGKINRKIAGFGHIGFPRLATKELGKLLNQNSAEYICKVALAFAERKDYKTYRHHSLYKLPFLRTNFLRNFIAIFVLAVLTVTVYLLFAGR